MPKNQQRVPTTGRYLEALGGNTVQLSGVSCQL